MILRKNEAFSATCLNNSMVVSSSYELQSFAAAIVMGILSGLIYDLAKSIRYILRKNTAVDIIMWALIIIISGGIWYRFQNGELRWYTVLGAALAAFLYFLLISKPVFCVFSFCVKKIYCFFNIILKILLTPLRFFCKILGVYIVKAKRKSFRKVEDKNYEKKAGL